MFWKYWWKKLDFTEVPRWVKRSKGKRFLKGYHFLYKLKKGNYYRKDRGLVYFGGIPKRKKDRAIRWRLGNIVVYTPKGYRNPFEP